MKMFHVVYGVLVFFTIWVMQVDLAPSTHEMHPGNVCRVKEKYNETKIIPKSVIVRQAKKTFCLAFPPICTYHIYKIKHKNETITVEKERFVFKCCDGFEKKDKSCVPVCASGCGFGECIAPNVCHCEPGWRGETCNQPCEVNRYGRNCMENCSCEHGATCDSKTGHCRCQPGYKGTYCELPCPEYTYGKDCKYNCTCENSALCDIKDGTCECQPGYYGEECEIPCERGYHGDNCEHECTCIWSLTEKCSHIDGTCFCRPGYTGKYCEAQCSNLTFGRNCEEYCQCENAEYCNTVTGECYCNAGWMGETCSVKCPEGYFGDDCLEKCVPCENENQTCHHETGECICPPGFHGNFCKNVCPENQWGPGCSRECKCHENISCDGITGECICGAGWTGEDCNQHCPAGKYGPNCILDCLCKNCDAETGSCKHVAGERKDTPSHVRTVVIVFSCILSVLLVFACVCCVNRFGPTIRNWWNSRFTRKTNTSTENILGVAFPNPLYSSTGETATERSLSFVNMASTIQARSSTVEIPKASSCDAVTEQGVSSLKRASKLSNLSAAISTENVDRNLKTESDDMTDDVVVFPDFIPEVLNDFNTPENIAENLWEIPK